MEKMLQRRMPGISELDQALFTATHFGFIPIRPPKVTEADLELTKHCGTHPHYDAAEKAALIRTYIEEDFASMSHPLALAFKKPQARKKIRSYSLHIIGSTSGVAEATLIRTALSILSEDGFQNLRVHLNCVGDKESVNIYERELINFVKKSNVDLPEEAKLILKDDIFNLFRVESGEFRSLRGLAPQAMAFLSLQSRIYFKEVLEYIEALGIDFRLSPELVGEKNHVSGTIFSIRDSSEEASLPLAIGYRYSRLSRLCGLRKEIPMAGTIIFCGADNSQEYKVPPIEPRFCLLQLGREAKVKTLVLLETLRTHRISVHHFLSKDEFSAQISNAENLPVSHLIIIGQKEALDNTATIRNVVTRAQDTVSLIDLPRYLKHIKL